MPSQKFIEDRRRTYEAQVFVADKLMAARWKVKIVKDGYFPYYDIEAENPKDEHVFIEVKRDYVFKRSGNFCLEIDSLLTKAAPRGRSLYLAILVDDPKTDEKICYLCDLKTALKIAIEYPVKGAWGEHGEISALVPMSYLESRLRVFDQKLYKFI